MGLARLGRRGLREDPKELQESDTREKGEADHSRRGSRAGRRWALWRCGRNIRCADVCTPVGWEGEDGARVEEPSGRRGLPTLQHHQDPCPSFHHWSLPHLIVWLLRSVFRNWCVSMFWWIIICSMANKAYVCMFLLAVGRGVEEQVFSVMHNEIDA